MSRTFATSVIQSAIYGTICSFAVGFYAYKRMTTKAVAEPSDKRLKVVVISGCDRGFGNLMAKAWKDDYLVVALTLSEVGVVEFPENIISICCDVTSDEQVQAMKNKVQKLLEERNAVLYAIVNNAGIADPGYFCFHDEKLEIPQKVMNVNYFGQLRVTQALLPFMLCTSQTVGAKIFNLSSVCGTTSSPGNSTYSASKFAVEAWSDALRLEMAPFSIQVVKIRPGQINTEIQSDWQTNFAKNYKDAPQQIQYLFGRSAFIDTMLSQMASMGNTDSMTQPDTVVDIMTELLAQTKKQLDSSYWIGGDAHTFWKALYHLPPSIADAIKAQIFTDPQTPPVPPLGAVSHVTIRVKSVEKALVFYQNLGFETWGDIENSCQFLKYNPSKKKNSKTWESLILLKEDSEMTSRTDCHDAGMTRLCILVESVDKMVEKLKTDHDIKPSGPVCEDKLASLAAFKDDDGFVVYFIEFRSMILNTILWWNGRQRPFPFHWTMNVTDHSKIFSMFEEMGFKTLSDQRSDQVLKSMLPAFHCDPQTTVIDWIRLCVNPKSTMVATIMKWVNPESAVNEASVTNAMTLSVANVEDALTKAKAMGMYVPDDNMKPSYRLFPVYGNVLVGTAYLEEGNCPVEFCCFSNQKPN